MVWNCMVDSIKKIFKALNLMIVGIARYLMIVGIAR
jgi:hypothetical protein